MVASESEINSMDPVRPMRGHQADSQRKKQLPAMSIHRFSSSAMWKLSNMKMTEGKLHYRSDPDQVWSYFSHKSYQYLWTPMLNSICGFYSHKQPKAGKLTKMKNIFILVKERSKNFRVKKMFPCHYHTRDQQEN